MQLQPSTWFTPGLGLRRYLEQEQEHGIMGRRFPDGGLLRYRKGVPLQLGDVIVVTISPPIGHLRSHVTNHQEGIILDVQTWLEKLY